MYREALIISSIITSFSVLTIKKRILLIIPFVEGLILLVTSRFISELFTPGLLLLLSAPMPIIRDYITRTDSESFLRVLALLSGFFGMIVVYQTGDLSMLMTLVMAVATVAGAIRKPTEFAYTWLSLFSFLLFKQYVEEGVTNILLPTVFALNILLVTVSRSNQKKKKEGKQKLIL